MPGTDAAIGVSPGWFALRVLANRERAVERGLRQSGFGAFVPAYTENSQWSDRVKVLDRPLFPGYVLTCVRLGDLSEVLQVSGVLSVLPSNLRPIAIPELEIDNVRRLLASLRPLTPSDFVAGDQITITRGSLRGVSGVVLRQAGGVRLVVTVGLLMRAVSVELDAADLARR